jgi:hypothetical protein
MTGKADFTQEEWQTVLEAPVSAGLIVVTAQRGGSFRESFAIAKAYTEARQQHGGSQLVDEIVAAKPQRDHTHYHSHEELKAAGLRHLQDAVGILAQKAAPDEVDGYRRFVVALAQRIAHAHREDGQEVSPAEQAALDEISAALGTT